MASWDEVDAVDAKAEAALLKRCSSSRKFDVFCRLAHVDFFAVAIG
jgi:hypothetical protein